jgi:hypothetical protein
LKCAPDVDEKVATAVATQQPEMAAVAIGDERAAAPADAPVTMKAVPTASCRQRVGSRRSEKSFGGAAAPASCVGAGWATTAGRASAVVATDGVARMAIAGGSVAGACLKRLCTICSNESTSTGTGTSTGREHQRTGAPARASAPTFDPSVAHLDEAVIFELPSRGLARKGAEGEGETERALLEIATVGVGACGAELRWTGGARGSWVVERHGRSSCVRERACLTYVVDG